MIDFGSPLTSAWKRCEDQLFRPFEIGKWFSLGFTAWLAGLLSGAGGSGNYSSSGNFGDGGGSFGGSGLRGVVHKITEVDLGIWLAIIVGLLFVVFLFGCLLIWLGARGQFMFLDNVLHNRAKVVQPWKDFRGPGNSLAWLGIGIWGLQVSLVAVGIVFALYFCWPDLISGQMRPIRDYVPVFLFGGLIVLIFVPLWILKFYMREFGIPVMRAENCSAWSALGRVGGLASERPLDFLIYLLVRMVMGFVFTVIAVVLGCCTCCLGFLPYLSTVLLLPLRVFRLSFSLSCLAQFGPSLSLWPSPEVPAQDSGPDERLP